MLSHRTAIGSSGAAGWWCSRAERPVRRSQSHCTHKIGGGHAAQWIAHESVIFRHRERSVVRLAGCGLHKRQDSRTLKPQGLARPKRTRYWGSLAADSDTSSRRNTSTRGPIRQRKTTAARFSEEPSNCSLKTILTLQSTHYLPRLLPRACWTAQLPSRQSIAEAPVLKSFDNQPYQYLLRVSSFRNKKIWSKRTSRQTQKEEP